MVNHQLVIIVMPVPNARGMGKVCHYQRCGKTIETYPYVSRTLRYGTPRAYYHFKCARLLLLVSDEQVVQVTERVKGYLRSLELELELVRVQ
jgi:hypothetical protein